MCRNVTDSERLNDLVHLVHDNLLDALVSMSDKPRADVNIVVRIVDHEADGLFPLVALFEPLEAGDDLLISEHAVVPGVHFQSKFQVIESEIYTKAGENKQKRKKNAKQVLPQVIYN
jgi:hypothetical protein